MPTCIQRTAGLPIPVETVMDSIELEQCPASAAPVTTLCINPQCPQPENPDDRDRCQQCGAQLRLGDRFRPRRLLGQGGFGRTFLAWDEAQQPPQPCVVKQIWRAQDARDRLLAEAERLGQLGQHPQIPSLIAILESPRDLCLVQSYVPGQTLAQALQATGPWTEPQVRSLLQDLLPVLQFIHNQGIIHRDIKPENILQPGETEPPVLVDFGAARTAPTATELARLGTVIGSAGYAAPEQALGKAVPASDLYSLGVTCLHLLTGQHPFDLYSVTEDRWIWQDYTLPPVSAALARVLERLTQRVLRSRYASAEEALADLAPAGILAQRPPPSPQLRVAPVPWRCTNTWTTPGHVVNGMAISPEGSAIATANSDSTVQLWDRQSGDRLHTFTQRLGFGDGHSDGVTAVAFHPHAPLLLSGSQDSTVKLWDLHRYRLQKTLRQPGWQITAIALCPDGHTLITAAADGRITVWALPTGDRRFDLVRHTDAVSALALSPTGNRLFSVGEAGTLRLWALPSGQLLHTWTAKASLRAVTVSAADPAVITGSSNGQISIWSLTDFEEQTILGQHQDAVTAIALSPNGRFLATGSRDREIHLWDWTQPGKQQLAVLRHDWGIRDLVFTPDSQTLVSSAGDETVRFWQAVG